MVKYTVDNTTVRCIISTENKTFIGIAKLNPIDTFNLEIGKQIAYKRALLKVKKHDIAKCNETIDTIQDLYNLYNKACITRYRLTSQMCSINEELEYLCNLQTTILKQQMFWSRVKLQNIFQLL